MAQQWSLLWCASLSLAACAGEAQVLQRNAIGGELVLRGALAPASAKARTLMAEHCGGRYLVREAERNDSAFGPANELSGRGIVRYRCASEDQSAFELAGVATERASEVLATRAR